MKRFLSLLTAAMIVLTILPVVSFAETQPALTDAQKAQILAQRRDTAEAHMRKIASMIWRCEVDTLFAVPDGVLPENASENFYLEAGRLYQGLPYSFSGGSYGSWLELTTGPDEKGVYTVADLNWQMISGGGPVARFGTDCSGAVTQSWSQIGASIRLQATKDMCPKYGYLRVGEYTASYDKVDDTEIAALDPQVMFRSYAQLQKADALVHNGHVRMAVSVDVVYNEDGTINGEESTVTYLEQTRQLMRNDTHYYNEALGEEVWELCGVDKVISFQMLYDYSYQPITCLELIDATAGPDAPAVKDSLSAKDYGFDTLLSGNLTTGSWVMDRVHMTITDRSGNTVQEGMITAPRSGVGNRYNVPMSMFATEAPTRMLGYISPDTLTAGDYHCKVVCWLTTGQAFTVRDFDFTVTGTKNDIHKTKIDFAQGTVHDCPMCGETAAQWQPLTTDYVGVGKGPAAGHYYLPESMENNTGYISFEGVNVCLHLNGKNITSTDRAITVSGSSILNIMGDGVVTGMKPENTGYGAALNCFKATVNLYGGTYRHNKVTETGATQRPVVAVRSDGTVNMYAGAKVEGDPDIKRSNVLIYKGRVNMYGGEVVNGYGGNGGNFLVGYDNSAYNLSYLCVYDGKIANGTATGMGGNIYGVYDAAVYIYGGQVTGGKAAKGGDLAVNAGANFRLLGGIVSGGEATGSGNAIYGTNVTTKVVSKTEIDETTGQLLEQSLYLRDCGVQIGENAHVEGEFYTEKNTYVERLSAETSLRLQGDVSRLTLNQDMHLNLNGHHVSSLVTDGHQLTVRDTATDDFVGAAYGTIPAGASYKAAENYLPVAEEDRVSFHKYALDIQSVTLKNTAVGLSYNCFLAGDEKVKEQIAKFGVAMSLYTPATQQSILQDTQHKTHVWRDGSLWQVGDAGQKLASVAVKNIMKTELTETKNRSRADVPVYGCAYLALKNGDYIFGTPVSRTFRQVTEQADGIYSTLDQTQKQALQNLYQTFKPVMDPWEISNIKGNN